MEENTTRLCIALNDALYCEGAIDARRHRLAEITLRRDLTRSQAESKIKSGEADGNGYHKNAPFAE